MAARVPRVCALALAAAIAAFTQENTAAPQLTRAEKEHFLRNAKIVTMRQASKGVTGSQRATLTDGKITHDAHIQYINEFKSEFKTDRVTELNFKDSYKFNVAAYKLDQILGLNMTPPSVERKVGGRSSAVTWWVDNIVMDEEGRRRKHIAAPDPDSWNKQMLIVRVFDELIYNTDRNLGNLLITKAPGGAWKLEMIDHTRAFRIRKDLRTPENLNRCDRVLFEKLKALDESTLARELRPYLTKTEIQALLARRDRILEILALQEKSKGSQAVFYDLLAR